MCSQITSHGFHLGFGVSGRDALNTQLKVAVVNVHTIELKSLAAKLTEFSFRVHLKNISRCAHVYIRVKNYLCLFATALIKHNQFRCKIGG